MPILHRELSSGLIVKVVIQIHVFCMRKRAENQIPTHSIHNQHAYLVIRDICAGILHMQKMKKIDIAF